MSQSIGFPILLIPPFPLSALLLLCPPKIPLWQYIVFMFRLHLPLLTWYDFGRFSDGFSTVLLYLCINSIHSTNKRISMYCVFMLVNDLLSRLLTHNGLWVQTLLWSSWSVLPHFICIMFESLCSWSVLPQMVGNCIPLRNFDFICIMLINAS